MISRILNLSARLLIVATVACQASLLWAAGPFSRLQERLVADGFDPAFIARVYDHPAVKFSPKPLLAHFRIRESRLNYGQFLSPAVVGKCRQYLHRHQQDLDKVREEYGVEPEIVVAVLMVETRLGSYTGRYNILNVLSSFAAAEDLELMKASYEQLPTPAKKRYSFSRFEYFCRRKSPWAYQELKAFLRYVQQTQTPPHEIYGSMSGALGFPQFLPSNILRYGRDGDQDGKVDLFSHADALASVGHFLKAHGWREDLPPEGKKKVLFKYNRSTYYVNAVLALARLLEE